MDYPAHATYAVLYARYLRPERTRHLLGLAGDVRGKTLYDLCGGGGRLSALALQAGASVTLVDESAAMAGAQPLPGLQVRVETVDHALRVLPPADVVVCQQAVNYWLDCDSAWDLAGVVRPGGLFIFNTFNTKPERTPQVKTYAFAGRQYVEVSQLVCGDRSETVEHVQVCEGLAPHTTRFRWIAREQFRQWLEPYFVCDELVDGATSVWRCVRAAEKA